MDPVALDEALRQKGKGPVPESIVRSAARDAGLVDRKVVAFSPTYTADKFVIPVLARSKSPPKSG